MRDPITRIVIDNLKYDVTIVPNTTEFFTCQARSGGVRKLMGEIVQQIQFSPALCRAIGQGTFGNGADETLLHELVHQMDDLSIPPPKYKNNPIPGQSPREALEFGDPRHPELGATDFMTITITNLYASNRHPANLRKDHDGFQQMPELYRNDAQEFYLDFQPNSEDFASRQKSANEALENAHAIWNPFQKPHSGKRTATAQSSPPDAGAPDATLRPDAGG